jgi:hypothetical protein
MIRCDCFRFGADARSGGDYVSSDFKIRLAVDDSTPLLNSCITCFKFNGIAVHVLLPWSADCGSAVARSHHSSTSVGCTHSAVERDDAAGGLYSNHAHWFVLSPCLMLRSVGLSTIRTLDA